MKFSFARHLIVMLTAFVAFSSVAVCAEERNLNLYNMNTKESLHISFKRNDVFDEGALKKLNWFLRDWRANKATVMDRELFDIVWNIYRQAGASAPIYVHSGYRSQSTNTLLRSRSSGVAKHSQHINGNAMDFHIPGVAISKLREIALRMQNGGVGFYPKANFPFVHVDSAEIRHWPPLSRQQIARLFPKGRSAYLPDARPMPAFKEVLANISARNERALPKASPNLAFVLPKKPPLPSDRPVSAESITAESAIPNLSVTENAYAPMGNPAETVFSRILDPHTALAITSFASLKHNGEFLKRDGLKLYPMSTALADNGVGSKGARLRATETQRCGWKVSGWLK